MTPLFYFDPNKSDESLLRQFIFRPKRICLWVSAHRSLSWHWDMLDKR